MEARFLHDGRSIQFVPNTDISAGTVVVFNNLIGVTKVDLPAGSIGVLALDGVYQFAKETEAFSTGNFAFWDETNKKVTAVATGNVYLGRVVRDALTDDETVEVRLEPITA
ncbi:MAG: DUF2190 family protein [Thermoguttaceae bacterium]|nr:DUF2190 family protein [Thermoguttaceae bacterium]